MARRLSHLLCIIPMLGLMLAWAAPLAQARVYCNMTDIEVEQLSNGVQITVKADGILNIDWEHFDSDRDTTSRFEIPFENARNETGKNLIDVSKFPVSHIELSTPQGAEEGIGVEVIDLRTLKPLDMDTVAASVRKTGRVVGVTEGYQTGSFISELAMRIQEEAFDWLDAPVVRVAAADVPVPMAETLEDAAIPSVERIIAGIRRALR